MSELDGPRIAPRRGPAKQLVVFLHGYGANGDDLIEIGRIWQQWMPETAFVAPHAPDAVPMAPAGRQWFPLTMRDPSEYWRGVAAAGPGLGEFLDAELVRHGLEDRRMALVGFSQGTMMALHVGLRRARAPAAIIGYSGMLAGPEQLPREIKAKPPVLLIHGEEDAVIPVAALKVAREALANAAVPVQWHISAGLGHGIDEVGLRQGGEFLVQSFAAG